MIASVAELRGAVGALLLCALLFGCGAARLAPAQLGEPLEPLSTRPNRLPGPEDFAAARLAAAALASNRPAMEIALDALEAEDAVRQHTPGDDDSDMLPLALDLVNATLDDPDDYRLASKQLMDNQEADRALRARLDGYLEDDPLKIARDRTIDAYQTIFARTFNAIAEPLGRSIIGGLTVAPLTIATTVAHYLATMYSQDPISLQARQALVQHQRFLNEHPHSPLAPEIRRKMEGPSRRLAKTFRNTYLRGAKTALKRANPRLARVFAKRSLDHDPSSAKAARLLAAAQDDVEDQQALRWASTRATSNPLPDLEPGLNEPALALAHALLLPGGDVSSAADALRAAAPDGPLADEADYALALGEFEKGWESMSWKRLIALSYGDVEQSNMVRHAAAIAFDPWTNVYGAFRRMIVSQNGRLVRWKLFGPWSQGARYDRLPPALAYLIDSPAVAQAIITSPIRLIMSTMKGDKNFQAPSSRLAYRYLERYPNGEYEEELFDWLYDYESKEKNWGAALRLADFMPYFDPKERMELSEKAASRQLENANKAKRRDMRGSVLRSVAREYPDSEAGHLAGQQARLESENASAQRIRMTRQFLEENPRIAGPDGLGLRAALRDEDPSNGELHPIGVTFLGGRYIEFAFLAESGNERHAPVLIRKQVSAERLSRVVALLEETQLHNSQVDPDDHIPMDAQRDYFLERARLGLTAIPDLRAAAESSYVYKGMRERYGMVRAREGVLPFDLVIQGSLGDFSIGAFPRIREPKKTPDAFLYR